MSKLPQKGPGGGGAVLAVWMMINFEYWSKFPGVGGYAAAGGKTMDVGLGGGGAVLVGVGDKF